MDRYQFALMILGLSLCAPAASLADDLPELSADRLEWAKGAFVASCAVCHDEDGTGSSIGEPPLNLIDFKWNHGGNLADIEKTIRDGVPDTKMKPQREKLSDEEIADLAKYVLLLSSKKHADVPEPERPAASKLTDAVQDRAPPAAAGPLSKHEHFIDQHIFGKIEADGIPHAGLCTDAEFVRRIYLDLWGRLPDSPDVRTFLADADPEKRNKLIDKLLGLAQSKETEVGEPFVSKWRYFFEDLFRNYSECMLDTDAFRNYIEGFVKSNVPYDFVVRDMLTATTVNHATSGAAGFLVRQAAGAGTHEDVCDQNTVYSTRNFLGVNLQCISCHDGAQHLEGINLWLSQKRRLDFWRQAAFFGDTRIFRPGGERFYVLFDGRLNRPAEPLNLQSVDQEQNVGLVKFQFAPLPNDSNRTEYRPDAQSSLRPPRDSNADVYPVFILDGSSPSPGINPRHELAQRITTSFQFAKVTVNLIWAQLMTVGIVDPPLDWDLARQDPDNPPPEPWKLQPSHPALLDALAKDFQEYNFDLRHLMRTICRSQAYQLSSRVEGDYHPDYDRYFARKLVRRLWAQEIYDALLKATTLEVAEEDFVMNSIGPSRDVIGQHDRGISRFLSLFGQSNRDTKDADTRGGSILQAAAMFNSKIVKEKVLAGRKGGRIGKLIQENPPWTWREAAADPNTPDPREKIVEELFLATVSRLPTKQELQVATEHLERYRDVGAEDIQWGLVNKLEFVVNR